MDVSAMPFGVIAELIHRHALEAPERMALRDDKHALTYRELDQRMDRVAASLQRDGLRVGDAVGICAHASVDYAAVFLGALRAGMVVAPLAPGSTPDSFVRMVRDANARVLFADAAAPVPALDGVVGVTLGQDATVCGPALGAWLAPEGTQPQPVTIDPGAPFNIIYSSGTTGEPKGIVQPHSMRWAHVSRAAQYGYGPGSVALLSTALYSNTTLVVFFPTLANGGCVALMGKFDAARYLAMAQQLRVTHTMLVPVQYRRLMTLTQFDDFDLSAFRFKFCTSAPFSAELKADVLARWPGGLVEFYGMTEGGGTCILEAHLHPTKLHTVGQAAEGHDIRLIDDAGVEVPAGEAGEVVGHSGGMMKGYHGQPERTREAEWFDPTGKRFIRTGDIGRFDAEGFLTLFDRKKDMVISGGFNIYPSDLEAVLRQHPGVEDAAVVGVPSVEWGETPVAFVVLRSTDNTPVQVLRDWANAQVGKTQRLSAVELIGELPRSPIGKVLKRELRDGWLSRFANNLKTL
jgi:long-chain acyl-CoA synthetase